MNLALDLARPSAEPKPTSRQRARPDHGDEELICNALELIRKGMGYSVITKLGIVRPEAKEPA